MSLRISDGRCYSDMMETSHERIYALDALRATMLLLGLVLHVALTYSVEWGGWPLKDVEASTRIADHAFYFIHYFRMPIFFILAGFFTALLIRRDGIVGLIKNRGLRIGIPFFLGLLILFPLVYLSFTFSIKAQNLSILNDTNTSIVGAMKYVVRSTSIDDVFPPENTTHLWFLYYLLYFYITIIPIALVARFIKKEWISKMRSIFELIIMNTMIRMICIISITAYVLFPAGGGILRLANTFTLDGDVYIAYFWFFIFGLVLYRSRHLLHEFERYAWQHVIAGLLVYLILSYWIWPNVLNFQSQIGIDGYIVTSIMASILVWLMFFGLTGIFMKYFNQSSRYVRYIVDASYWIYLIHLPIVVLIPGLIVATGLSAMVKIFIVLSITFIIGLLTYDLFVRSTILGVLLNGKKYNRGLGKVV